MTEDVSGLIYLVNGVLCLFVVEAVRRPTVISVWVPLRRATALGLLLSVPAFFIHEELNTINEWTQLPEWAWVLVASVLIFVISRLHEFATELVDELFDRDFHHARQHLAAAGQTIQRAESLAEVDRLLVDEPMKALHLASAALFRAEDGLLQATRQRRMGRRSRRFALQSRARCSAGSFTAAHSRSTRSAASIRPTRAFPRTWRGRFSACRSAIRDVASPSRCTAATLTARLLTTTSANFWWASRATRRSPMPMSTARAFRSGSRFWKGALRAHDSFGFARMSAHVTGSGGDHDASRGR